MEFKITIRQKDFTAKLADSEMVRQLAEQLPAEADIRPFFEKQLKWCGVDYFDFYLMHAQDQNNYQKYKKCKAYETVYSFKEEGLIRHFGISFHDKANVLDMIHTEHPEIEIVQVLYRRKRMSEGNQNTGSFCGAECT